MGDKGEGISQAHTLTVCNLILLNCIVCGLELVASAALVYLPPMLLEAGVEDKYMSWVLGLGPGLCLFIVPVLGRWMDTCTSRFGRRIPFMFILSLMVLLALVLIPYADHMLPERTESTSGYSVHVYLLAMTVVLIDFSTQAGLTPCEVFLQDITKGLPIRDRAFSLYSLMCSVGSCAGYLILAINWEKTILGTIFGDQEYCVFSLLFVIFLVLMVVNLQTASKIRNRQNIRNNKSFADMQMLQAVPKLSDHSLAELKRNNNCSCLSRFVLSIIPQGIVSLFTIPYALRRLVYANFFSWAAVMAFLLFYTDYMGEVVYGGKPSAAVGTVLRHQYDDGVRMGSFGLFLHAVMSSITATAIEKLQNIYGMKAIHFTSLLIFTFSIILILLTSNLVVMHTLSMATGIAFASMTTIPFSLVGMYHEDKEVFFPDSQSFRGLGMDMATLDTSYFCSQVLLLTFMGYIVHLTGSASMYLVTAAILSTISCYFIFTAVYNKSDMPRYLFEPSQPPQGPAILITSV
ncbi:solute carrier family 45 member 3-like [Watersipora subatra]|uniref:solute carrier family 45 member 3-like n=1 Tax=Watersipora subatra TaxID=2589382 RepID=UPI00355C2568